MNGENTILVDTELLKRESEIVEASIYRLKEINGELDAIVNGISDYWVGDGADAHIKAYKKMTENTEEVYARLHEHVVDLQEMAGIYEKAENDNITEIDSLPSDLIV